MAQWRVVEKQNTLAVHCMSATQAGAQRWIDEKAPVYCARGYFVDKTLTPDSFMVQEVTA